MRQKPGLLEKKKNLIKTKGFKAPVAKLRRKRVQGEMTAGWGWEKRGLEAEVGPEAEQQPGRREPSPS